MWIADLKIENFRGIRSCFVRFHENTVIIGPNNSGKTTIIEALALLFGRDRMIRSLTEHDFYGCDPQPADRINIRATVTGFSSDNPANHVDWFGDGRGVPKWYVVGTGEVLPARTATEQLLACQLAFSARFDRSMLEVESVRYFYDGTGTFEDVFAEENYVGISKRLMTELGFFLVPANRAWDKVISFGSELFKRLITAGGGPPADSVLSTRDQLRSPRQPLEADPNLLPIIEAINSEMSGFFPSAPELKLRLTATDSEGVLESVIPHFSQSDIGQVIPSRRHGNGLISLQWLLLLLQFGRLRAEQEKNFIMALEEPELHIPPSLQQRLVHRLQALSSQSIITTHSPTVAVITDPTKVVVIHKESGVLVAKNLLENPLTAVTPNSTRKLFQLNRVDTISALMHDLVVVPEGRIDFDIIKLLIRAVNLRQEWVNSATNDFGTAIGLIPTHDGSVVETYRLISSVHSKVSCIVDGDAAGIDYATAILGQAAPRSIIVTWPTDWTIEDVLGWIFEANPGEALRLVNQSIPTASPSIGDLITRLKSTDRAIGGLKQDYLVYEWIAEVIYEVKVCNERAQELLAGMAKALINQPSARFQQQHAPREKVYLFQP